MGKKRFQISWKNNHGGLQQGANLVFARGWLVCLRPAEIELKFRENSSGGELHLLPVREGRPPGGAAGALHPRPQHCHRQGCCWCQLAENSAVWLEITRLGKVLRAKKLLFSNPCFLYFIISRKLTTSKASNTFLKLWTGMFTSCRSENAETKKKYSCRNIWLLRWQFLTTVAHCWRSLLRNGTSPRKT